MSEGEVFQVFNTLQIALHDLTTCARTCTTDGVTCLDDRRDHILHFHFIVVRTDSVYYRSMLTIFLSQLGTQQGVAQFSFFIRYFTNVMQQTGTFRQFRVQTQFSRHHSAKVSCFF